MVTTDETISVSVQPNLGEGTILSLKSFFKNMIAGLKEITLATILCAIVRKWLLKSLAHN